MRTRRPIVDELQAGSHSLPTLQQLATGGAMTSAHLKRELHELLPHVMIVDGYGASETGGMALDVSSRNAKAHRFRGGPDACVLSADRSRLLEPGDDEIGWVARVGRVPLGYLNDREQTERTFPIVDGRRRAVPGDRARLDADGSIELLGRDSTVVNSGGEKVFVEEVEEAIRRHPNVADAVVVGRPSDRFGEEVVAVVQPRTGTTVTPAEIRDFAATTVARFKAPRALVIVDRVARHPSGKADYRSAREATRNAVSVEGQ